MADMLDCGEMFPDIKLAFVVCVLFFFPPTKALLLLPSLNPLRLFLGSTEVLSMGLFHPSKSAENMTWKNLEILRDLRKN